MHRFLRFLFVVTAWRNTLAQLPTTTPSTTPSASPSLLLSISFQVTQQLVRDSGLQLNESEVALFEGEIENLPPRYLDNDASKIIVTKCTLYDQKELPDGSLELEYEVMHTTVDSVSIGTYPQKFLDYMASNSEAVLDSLNDVNVNLGVSELRNAFFVTSVPTEMPSISLRPSFANITLVGTYEQVVFRAVSTQFDDNETLIFEGYIRDSAEEFFGMENVEMVNVIDQVSNEIMDVNGSYSLHVIYSVEFKGQPGSNLFELFLDFLSTSEELTNLETNLSMSIVNVTSIDAPTNYVTETGSPSINPTSTPSYTPSINPSNTPSSFPSTNPTDNPTFFTRSVKFRFEHTFRVNGTTTELNQTQVDHFATLIASYTDSYGLMQGEPNITTTVDIVNNVIQGAAVLSFQYFVTYSTKLPEFDDVDYSAAFIDFIENEANSEQLITSLNDYDFNITQFFFIIDILTPTPSRVPSGMPSVSTHPSFADIAGLTETQQFRQVFDREVGSGVFSDDEMDEIQDFLESSTDRIPGLVGNPLVTTLFVLDDQESLNAQEIERIQLDYSLTYQSRHIGTIGEYPGNFSIWMNNEGMMIMFDFLIEKGISVDAVDKVFQPEDEPAIPSNTPSITPSPSLQPSRTSSSMPSLMPSKMASVSPTSISAAPSTSGGSDDNTLIIIIAVLVIIGLVAASAALYVWKQRYSSSRKRSNNDNFAGISMHADQAIFVTNNAPDLDPSVADSSIPSVDNPSNFGGSSSSPVRMAAAVAIDNGNTCDNELGPIEDVTYENEECPQLPAPAMLMDPHDQNDEESNLAVVPFSLAIDGNNDMIMVENHDENNDEMDSFDHMENLFSHPGLEQMREEINWFPESEEVVSKALTNAYMDDEHVHREVMERYQSLKPMEIEASVLCDAYEWLKKQNAVKSHTGEDQQQQNIEDILEGKRFYIQEIVDQMVLAVRYDLIRPEHASMTIHGCAILFHFVLEKDPPETTILVTGMPKTVNTSTLTKAFAEFGEIEGAACASNSRGFGVVRYLRKHSVKNVLNLYHGDEVVVQNVAVTIRQLKTGV